MSVQLSEPDEYEGGELEFLNFEQPIPKDIGSLIVFPSYLVHRVNPVTRGLRRSMVSWISGPPFR
jgi:PKHD-type hydroxylase